MERNGKKFKKGDIFFHLVPSFDVGDKGLVRGHCQGIFIFSIFYNRIMV